MLFSELNRINLNVLVKDTDQERLPNLENVYVHNKVDWTIFCRYTDHIADAKEISSYDVDISSSSDANYVPDFYLMNRISADKVDAIFTSDYKQLNGTTTTELYIEPDVANSDYMDKWKEWINHTLKHPQIYLLYSKVNGKYLRDTIVSDNIYQLFIDDDAGKLDINNIPITDISDNIYDRLIVNSLYDKRRHILEVVNGKLFNTTKYIDDSSVDSEISVYNGWSLSTIKGSDLEDTYIRYALNDIAQCLKLKSDVDSDIVKLYAGALEYDGTLDFSVFNDNDSLFKIDRLPGGPHHHPRYLWNQNCCTWWGTISNGAFQWSNHPKDIVNCRFHYDQFCGHSNQHYRHVDHDHFRPYDKNIMEPIEKNIVPNLIFIFDKQHHLRGIVSLPCHDDSQRLMEKNFIKNFQAYSADYAMHFDNFEEVLRGFMSSYGYWPNICISKSIDEPNDSYDTDALIMLANPDSDWQNNDIENLKFIPLFDNQSMEDFIIDFATKSIWSSYSLEDLIITSTLDINGNKIPVNVKVNDGQIHHYKNDKTTFYLLNLKNLFKNSYDIAKDFDPNYDLLCIFPTEALDKLGFKTLDTISNSKIIELKS